MGGKGFKEFLESLDLRSILSSVLGIDLAGSSSRKTGIALVVEREIKTCVVYTNDEILELAKDKQYIYIDAPLSIPHGRKTLDEKDENHFRECDLALRKLGMKFFPVTLGPMRLLTKRGILLKEVLTNQGKQVYEVFPGAFYDTFGVKRKQRDTIIALFMSLAHALGLNMPCEPSVEPLTQDELDAIACLLTGLLHQLGLAEILSGIDGEIIIPSSQVKIFL